MKEAMMNGKVEGWMNNSIDESISELMKGRKEMLYLMTHSTHCFQHELELETELKAHVHSKLI